MILVSVGTHTQPFNRLLEKIDELIGKGILKEKLIAQIGNSTYVPKNYEYFTFVSEKKIQELNKKANIIITQAGAGSIITALKYKKKIIVVPRLKKFNEHVNDHQVQIAKIFEKQRKVLVCYDINDLDKILRKIKKFKPKFKNEKPKMLKIIKRFFGKRKIKVCIICSAGGHLIEAMQLSPVFSRYKHYFLTIEREQSKELLKNKKVFYILDPRRNPIKVLINLFQAFRIFMREKPDVIISTGAGIAIPTCYIGKLFGSKIIFVESIAAVTKPSLSGRFAYPVADLFIVQWDGLLSFYRKAVYGDQLI